MKKITLVAAILGSAYFANAQVGIGTATPSTSAMLHIESSNKGVVIPNVELTSTAIYAPIVGDTQTSLLVYNIATSSDSSTATAVSPGFYYWENSQWQRITTKAELYAAVGNVTNIQSDLDTIKKILKVGYPSNNINGDTSTIGSTFGGGMVFTPGTDSSTVGQIEYVYFDGTNYVKQDITATLKNFISNNETKTYIVTYNKKQYYLSESFKGDTNTSNWTSVPTGAILIDVVGGVVNNFSEIIGDTSTIVTINGDTMTIANYFNSLAGDSNTVYFNNTNNSVVVGDTNVAAYTFYLKDKNGNAQTINLAQIVKATETVTTLVGDSTTAIYTYTNEKGDTTTINIRSSVVNNFVEILNDTTTYNNKQVTIKNIIEEIAANASGNMTFIPGADSATFLSNSKFEYIDNSGNVNIVLFKDIVAANETLTFLERKADTGTFDSTTLQTEPTAALGKVIYRYSSEKGIQYIDITADVLNSFNNNDVINAIKNITKSNGDVYYTTTIINADTATGQKEILANNFYIVKNVNGNEIKEIVTVPIDINQLITTINNATIEEKNKIKQALGDTYTTNNTSVFTGNTYVDGTTTYYIYKGVFTTNITANTAVTTGIILDKAAHEILSIDLKYDRGTSKGLTASLTDIKITADTSVAMNIGVGNTYNVLHTQTITNAKVIVEFASAIKP